MPCPYSEPAHASGFPVCVVCSPRSAGSPRRNTHSGAASRSGSPAAAPVRCSAAHDARPAG